MTIEEYICLIDWLKVNKQNIEKNEQTQGEVQAMAEMELNYKVPLSSIQRCAKIIKLNWANSPPKPPEVPIGREAIIILIGAVSGLYIETGKTVPDALANLQSAYVRNEKQNTKRGYQHHTDCVGSPE